MSLEIKLHGHLLPVKNVYDFTDEYQRVRVESNKLVCSKLTSMFTLLHQPSQ